MKSDLRNRYFNESFKHICYDYCLPILSLKFGSMYRNSNTFLAEAVIDFYKEWLNEPKISLPKEATIENAFKRNVGCTEETAKKIWNCFYYLYSLRTIKPDFVGEILKCETLEAAKDIYWVEKNISNVKSKQKKNNDILLNSLNLKKDITYVHGQKNTFEVLINLTLQEPEKIRVTRFSPIAIQNNSEYYDCVLARLTGGEYLNKKFNPLTAYHRLTSFNSEENKQSILKQIDTYLEKKLENIILCITFEKNDFEIVLCDLSQISVMCFHDSTSKDVLNSSFIICDKSAYPDMQRLYDNRWNANGNIEVDFRKGREHVLQMRKEIEGMRPI